VCGRVQSQLVAENDCKERPEVQEGPFFTPVFSVGLDPGWCYVVDRHTGCHIVHTAEQIGGGVKMNKSGTTASLNRLAQLNCSWLIYMTNNFTVVACAYAIPPIELAKKLDKLAKSLSISVTGVIVTNNIVHGDAGNTVNFSVISGSNSVLDFSAYYEGLQHLEKTHKVSTEVIFINDTLFTKHHAGINFKSLIRQIALLRKIKIQAMTGKIDHYLTIILKNQWSHLPMYVTTFCFAINKHGLSAFKDIYDSLAIQLPYSKSPVSLLSEQWGKTLPPSVVEYIRGFLVYQHDDFSWGASVHQMSDEFISKKAMCIYLEQRLSGEFGLNGCILPTNIGLKNKILFDWSERYSKLRGKFSKF